MAVDLEAILPKSERWEGCPEDGKIAFDIAYGGAFCVSSFVVIKHMMLADRCRV